MPRVHVSRRVAPSDGETFFNQAINDLDYLSHVDLPSSGKSGFEPSKVYCLPFCSSLYANREVMPIAFCIVSEKTGKVQLWVESLLNQSAATVADEDSDVRPLNFYCAHTLVTKRHRGAENIDVCLLSLDSQQNSATFQDVPVNTPSALLDPLYQDYVSLEKGRQEYKMYNNTMTPSLKGKTSQDFLALLINQELTVFSVQGLRNYPQMHVEVQPSYKFRLTVAGLQGLRLRSLVAGGTDSFMKGSHQLSNTLSLTGISTSGEMLQLRALPASERAANGTSSLQVAAMKVDKVYEARYHELGPVCSHPSLPLATYSIDGT